MNTIYTYAYSIHNKFIEVTCIHVTYIALNMTSIKFKILKKPLEHCCRNVCIHLYT